MPLFKSKEEKEIIKNERAQLKAEKKRIRIEKAQEEYDKAHSIMAQRRVELDARNAIRDERMAKRQIEIDKINAHNKAVIQDWLGDVREIKSDFINEQRAITRNSRNKPK